MNANTNSNKSSWIRIGWEISQAKKCTAVFPTNPLNTDTKVASLKYKTRPKFLLRFIIAFRNVRNCVFGS